MSKTINCPVCGKLADGRLDSCPHCGAFIRKQQPARPAQSATGLKSCPHCKAKVSDVDIFCVACGTNLLTGKREQREVLAPRRKVSSGWLIGGGIALTFVVMGGLFWLYLATSDPLNKALSLIEDREYLEAQTILSAYVQREQANPKAYFELGRLQWRARQYPGAAESFVKAAELEPDNVTTALWAVVALSEAGGPSLRQGQIALLEHVVELGANDPALWYLLALMRGSSGDVPGEIQALERVIESWPTDNSARLSMGLSHALRGDYDKARHELTLVGDGARKGDALAVEAFVANLEGSHALASQRFAQALEVDGLNARWQVRAELGKLRMREGRFREAQADLEEALSLRQNDPYIQYLRAVCLQALGRTQDAINQFEEVAREQRAYAMESKVQTAQAYLAMDMPDRAKLAIDQAQNMGGSGAPFFTIQGRVRAIEGDDTMALNSFRRAIDTNPRYPAAYLERGLLHVRTDQLSAGLQDLEKYLELVGSETRGTRAADIRALTDQLRQAAGGEERRGGRTRTAANMGPKR